MDPALLMTLLAAQGGRASGTQDYLARARTEGGAALNPQELLAQMGNDNPTIATMMQLMAAQKAAVPPQTVNEDNGSDEEIAELRAWLDASQNELGSIKEQLRAAHTEVAVLRERTEDLADALGACCLCWGHDPNCRACRGHGRPGRSVPDEALFSEYVIPAVHLMHASRQRASAVTTLVPATRATGTDSKPMRHTS